MSFNIPPVIIHAFHPSIICDGDECSNVNISREKCEWMIWNTCICQSCHTINYEFIGWMKTQKYNSVHFQTSNSNIIIHLYPCTEYHFYFLSSFFLRKPNFVYDKYKVYQFYRIYTIKTSFKNSDQMFTHLVTLFEDVHLINKSIAFDWLNIRDTYGLNHYIPPPSP